MDFWRIESRDVTENVLVYYNAIMIVCVYVSMVQYDDVAEGNVNNNAGGVNRDQPETVLKRYTCTVCV